MNNDNTDPYDDIPTEEISYHWFVQGFLASREGFNAESTHHHLNANMASYWQTDTPTLTHDDRELLRELFEAQWNDA